MKLFVIGLSLLLLNACNRQFAISVNEQPVYDPRGRIAIQGVADADLQGCINFALSQQEIAQPGDIRVLSCANAGVRSLEGIDALSSLQYLDLAANAITRLAPLTTLPRLSSLHIPENPVSDIEPLLEIPSLTSVSLRGNTSISCRQLDRLEEKLGENLTRPASCQQGRTGDP